MAAHRCHQPTSLFGRQKKEWLPTVAITQYRFLGGKKMAAHPCHHTASLQKENGRRWSPSPNIAFWGAGKRMVADSCHHPTTIFWEAEKQRLHMIVITLRRFWDAEKDWLVAAIALHSLFGR